MKNVFCWPDETPIEELNLYNRAYNQLYENGYRTVGDIVAKTEAEIGAIPWIGYKTLNNIIACLAFGHRKLKDSNIEFENKTTTNFTVNDLINKLLALKDEDRNKTVKFEDVGPWNGKIEIRSLIVDKSTAKGYGLYIELGVDD